VRALSVVRHVCSELWGNRCVLSLMIDIAVLVIDMQLGNFGANPVYKANDLLARTKSVIQKARAARIPIVYVQNCGGKGDPDEYGSDGWKIHPSIASMKGDIVVRKKTPDAFHQTDLHEKLKSIGVRNIVVVGLQTEYCVDTTCRRAFSLGYNITLVKDAHSTWDSPVLSAEQVIDHHNRVLGGFFVTLKSEQEIVF
jgi:nicotinamidase-related amidase